MSKFLDSALIPKDKCPIFQSLSGLLSAETCFLRGCSELTQDPTWSIEQLATPGELIERPSEAFRRRFLWTICEVARFVLMAESVKWHKQANLGRSMAGQRRMMIGDVT